MSDSNVMKSLVFKQFIFCNVIQYVAAWPTASRGKSRLLKQPNVNVPLGGYPPHRSVEILVFKVKHHINEIQKELLLTMYSISSLGDVKVV